MIKADTMIKLLIAFVSICIGLVLVEFAIGFLVPLREVGPSFSLYDPVLGQRLKPGFRTVRKTPEFTMRLSTNSLGFRGPPMKELPKGPILFLGDSFTMGYGVDDGKEFPALVAARLGDESGSNAVPVVNAGIGNSGNGRWVKLLRSIGKEMQPRLIVMQMLDNDFADNQAERLFKLDEASELEEVRVPPPGPGRGLQTLIESVPGLASTNVVALLREIRWNGQVNAPAASSVVVESDRLAPEDGLTIAIVEAAVLLCQENGWPVLALVIGFDGLRQAAVRDVFAKHGVDIIEMPGKKERPDLYYKIDGHWNEAGHVAAADRVLIELRRLGISH